MPNPNIKIFSPDDRKGSPGERLLNATLTEGRNLCNYGVIAQPSAYELGAEGRERDDDGTFITATDVIARQAEQKDPLAAAILDPLIDAVHRGLTKAGYIKQ